MSDDLLKRLPHVGELTLPMWQDWLVRYNDVLTEQQRLIEHLKCELEEERRSREAAAAKAWEFSERIELLEKTLLEIANAVGDPSAYWIAHVALEMKNDQ